jgi:hypothetical protein
MKLEGEQVLLRVSLRNTDRHGMQSAAEALVERARREGLAGATLLRGIYGLDFDGRLLNGGSWSLAEHLPVVVELVDTRERIGRFLSAVGEVVTEAVATLERAHVMVYRQNHTTETVGALGPIPEKIPDLSTVPDAEEFPIMKLAEDGLMLRIFLGESDVWEGEPLARAIVYKAKELGLAGATVLRGAMGFGANSRVHTSRLLELSADLPIVVEIVDARERIDALLPWLDESVREGLITVESVRVLKYRHRGS